AGSISCSSFISVFTYYVFVTLTATLSYLATLLPLTQMFDTGADGKKYPQKTLNEYGGVYRETIRFEVSNSFAFTWCTPHGNSTFFDAASDLPSPIRYIEFYAWIGVYVKMPLISGLLYRCFMILAEEREAIYYGKTANSVIGCMRVITHLLECISTFLFVGMHQDFDRPLLWLHRSSLSLLIISSSFNISLTAISLFRRKRTSKLILTCFCLFLLLVSFPAVQESNYYFFLDHSCSLKVSPRLAIAEYLLFSSLILFHFTLLPLSLPTLEVSLSFYDDHPNYVPDKYKPLYQPVVPHLTF
ncbi:hypothetical protein PMAYCL1PPCAC_29007, partial [Pristionchus mayeri]